MTRKAQNIRPTPPGGAELAPREKIMVPDPSSELETEDGAEGEDEASGGDDEASGQWEKIANVVVLEDGSVSPRGAELLALAQADGLRGGKASDCAGLKRGAYVSRIRASPVFDERVRVLTEERTKLEALGVEGEALWAVKQNWRLARAGGVVMEIHRATVLLVETTRTFLGVEKPGDAPAAAPAGDAPAKPGPGRPAHQPKALRFDIENMKSALISKGIKAPSTTETVQ